jgi:uncharacterized protein YdeI (YjbR/CyaY-like superfamily)
MILRPRSGLNDMTANGGADMNHASVMLSSTPRVLDVPPDLADALEREDAALRYFERLSYDGQERVVASVAAARGARTRRRRIAQVLGTLREGWAH